MVLVGAVETCPGREVTNYVYNSWAQLVSYTVYEVMDMCSIGIFIGSVACLGYCYLYTRRIGVVTFPFLPSNYVSIHSVIMTVLNNTK